MNEMNRRSFLTNAGTTALAAGAAAQPLGLLAQNAAPAAPSPAPAKAPDDSNLSKVRIACIGLFGRGKSHIDGFSSLPGVEVVALCDPDEATLNRRAQELEKAKGNKPKLYKDMRQLFEDKDIDAVSIATPNHWHALAGIWACQAGKDVYVEKPCSHNIWEGRQLVKAARKYNRIVQMGTQSRSNEGMREGIQKLKDGAIGEIYMAKGLCYKWRASIGTAGPSTPPSSLDYDIWSGPAELLPYTRHRHPYNWHWFWNYGNGDIGNQGVHEMDKARWGLGVGLPTRVEAMGGKYMFEDSQETPNTMISTFSYPDQKKLLVFEVRHWISNPELGEQERGDNNVGNIFYGSEGYMVMPSYSSYQIFLGKKAEPQPAVSKGGDHWANFIKAVRSRKMEDLNCEIEEGHLSSALCHLANIAYRTGRSLDFDPATERFVKDDEANKMLTREYRKPFVVPEEV